MLRPESDIITITTSFTVNFEQGQVLLWLVEFQEDKRRFSIYKLLRYVTDLLEQYPDALLIPTVLFTKRGKWRKDVNQELNSEWGGRQLLHFEYVLLKLFDHKPGIIIIIVIRL